MFDYTGELPGLEAVAGRTPRARVAMLESSSATPVGPGRVKLVQVLDGDGPPPVPAGQAWGEVGVCEICLHVRNVQEVHDALVAGGCASLMEPTNADVPPTGITLDIAYVADPWGTKLELIEWTGLWRSLPGPPRAEGVNHVAFGVTDMERTRAFYARLGFTELLFESVEFFDPMAPWFEAPWYDPGNLPAQHMTMPMPAQGAAIEPVVLDPPGHDCRGTWGHLGPMDFGIRVANLDARRRASRPTACSCTARRSRSTSVRASGATSTSWSPTATTSSSSRRAIERATRARSRPGGRRPCRREPR